MTQAIKSADKAQHTPKIERTKEYHIFKFMGANRKISENHVRELMEEMRENPDWFANDPMKVNEHFFIIDGQHRYLAAKRLGKPLYYIVVDGATVDEARRANVTQRRWTLLDFARSYADGGNPNYKTFLQMVEQYPRLSASTIQLTLGNVDDNGGVRAFRRGNFNIANIDSGKHNLVLLDRIAVTVHEKLNKSMVRSLLTVLKLPEFDFEKFMGKLEKEHAREYFVQTDSVRGNIRSIENVYNFQSKFLARLY